MMVALWLQRPLRQLQPPRVLTCDWQLLFKKLCQEVPSVGL